MLLGGGRRKSITPRKSRKAEAGAGEALAASDGPDEGELLKVFKKVDLDNNGSLDLNELEYAGRELGIKCSQNAMRKVFKMIDKDNSGAIDFVEFTAFFGQVNDPEKIKEMLSSASASFLDYRARVENDSSFARSFPVPSTVAPAQKYCQHHESTVQSVAWLSGNRFITAAAAGNICVWDASVHADRPAPVLQSNLQRSGVFCMGTQPEASDVLVGFGSRRDNLWLWDVELSKVKCKFGGADSFVYSCSLQGGRALAGVKDGSVLMFDIQRSEPDSKWKAHEGLINSCCFDSDGHRILTSSRDGNVHVLDPRAGDMPDCLVSTIEDAAAGYVVYQALWCGDNEILSAGDDYCVKRWDIRMPANPPVASYMGHVSGVKAISLSADKRFFATGCSDSSMRVWATDPSSMKSSFTTAEGYTSLEDQVARLLDKHKEIIANGDEHPSEPTAISEQVAQLDSAVADKPSLHKGFHASLSFTGHSMSVASMAWQDLDNGKARIVTGGCDESALVFDVNLESLLL